MIYIVDYQILIRRLPAVMNLGPNMVEISTYYVIIVYTIAIVFKATIFT